MFSNVDYSVLCVFGDKLSNTKLKHSFKTPFQSLNAALQGLEGVEVRHSETRKKSQTRQQFCGVTQSSVKKRTHASI